MNEAARPKRGQSHTSAARTAPHAGHAPVTAQPGHRLGERSLGEVSPQVALDRGHLGVEGEEHRAVAGEGAGEGLVTEGHLGQPGLVTHRPVGAVTKDHTMAEQELDQPVPGPGPVDHQIAAGAAQVADGFFGLGRNAHRGQLADPIELGQPPGVPAVGLDPGTGGHRDQRRGDDLAGHPQALEQTGQGVAGGPGFVADRHGLGVPPAEHQALDRGLVGEDAVDHRHLGPGDEHGRGDRVLVDVEAHESRVRIALTMEHGWLLQYVAPPNTVTHAGSNLC